MLLLQLMLILSLPLRPNTNARFVALSSFSAHGHFKHSLIDELLAVMTVFHNNATAVDSCLNDRTCGHPVHLSAGLVRHRLL